MILKKIQRLANIHTGIAAFCTYTDFTVSLARFRSCLQWSLPLPVNLLYSVNTFNVQLMTTGNLLNLLWTGSGFQTERSIYDLQLLKLTHCGWHHLRQIQDNANKGVVMKKSSVQPQLPPTLKNEQRACWESMHINFNALFRIVVTMTTRLGSLAFRLSWRLQLTIMMSLTSKL